ncbi:MAG TPA: sulfotransferase [Parafilimonas sp.]
MSLQVIGSGVGRTGTHSLKLALEQLGFEKCYHMMELFQHSEGLTYFQKAERGETVDWDKLFEGYKSAVDYPVARYYKQLIAAYPNAKIIHTIREAESWYQSAIETIFWATKPSPGRILSMLLKMPFNATLRKRFPILKYDGLLMDNIFGKDLKNKQEVIRRYNAINEETLNYLPKDRSLVYEVKQGWQPLCNFLNVPVPLKPFPRSNVRDEFKIRVAGIASGKPVENNV